MKRTACLYTFENDESEKTLEFLRVTHHKIGKDVHKGQSITPCRLPYFRVQRLWRQS